MVFWESVIETILQRFFLQESGGVMEQLEAAVNDKQKQDASIQSTLDSIKDSLKAEQKKKKQLSKQMSDVSLFNFLININHFLCPPTGFWLVFFLKVSVTNAFLLF